MRSLVVAGNAVLAFALELVMLAGFGWWAYRTVPHAVLRWVAAVGLVALVVAVWGIWAAPTSGRRLSGVPLHGLQLGLMLVGAALFWQTGARTPALVLASLAVLTQLLTLVTGQA